METFIPWSIPRRSSTFSWVVGSIALRRATEIGWGFLRVKLNFHEETHKIHAAPCCTKTKQFNFWQSHSGRFCFFLAVAIQVQISITIIAGAFLYFSNVTKEMLGCFMRYLETMANWLLIINLYWGHTSQSQPQPLIWLSQLWRKMLKDGTLWLAQCGSSPWTCRAGPGGFHSVLTVWDAQNF